MISFSDAPGNFFNVLGQLGNLLQEAASYQSTQYTNLTSQTKLVGEFSAGGEADLIALFSDTRNTLPNGAGAAAGAIGRTVAEAALNRIVFRDNPQPGQTENIFNTLDAARELIRQMKDQGATVLAQTVAVTPGTFSGTGNGGICVSSVRRPSDGLVLEHLLRETLFAQCVADSYTGSRTAGNETIRVAGEGAQGDVFARDWPLGSGSSLDYSAIDGDAGSASGNLLTNSGFNTWSGGAASGWDLTEGKGDWAVNLHEEVSNVYGTGSALRLVGDSAGTLVEWQQDVSLDPVSQYAYNGFFRRDGMAAAAGTLIIELVDGSGVVINDANGVANQITINLTTLTVEYTAYNGVFRTPRIMPTTASLRYRLSVALTNGRSIYIDRAGLGLMRQQYTPYGPYLAFFSGKDPFSLGDRMLIEATNSRGAGGTLHTFQTLFGRLLPTAFSNGLMLPSSATPSISDTLI